MNITKYTVTSALATALALFSAGTGHLAAAQEASPTPTWSCATMPATSQMPGMMGTPMGGMMMGTPMAGAGHDMAGMTVEFDQMYIDMMLPHHASIIALAQAAQERLTDERLQTIASNIITAQSAENEELRGYREHWFGGAQPMPMDQGMMGMMMQMMPGMGDMASMRQQMDSHMLVAAFCTGKDPDLAFIDLVIPHHQMAIQASEAALDQATHEEMRAVAEQVIQAQQAEIDELETIREDLTAGGTPAAS